MTFSDLLFEVGFMMVLGMALTFGGLFGMVLFEAVKYIFKR
jgi:hypothetical protein